MDIVVVDGTDLHHHEQPHDSQLETMNEAMPRLITTLSTLLDRAAESNNLMMTQQKVSAFDGLTRPTISVLNYLERIFKYANCSSSCFVVAYVYLDRFTHRHPMIPINSFNVHRLLITSIMLAAKFMDDLYYNNAYYAKIGGITTPEMNFLELDFLFGLGFNLNVTPKTFNAYCYHLQREMMLQQLTLIPRSLLQLPTDHHTYCNPSVGSGGVNGASLLMPKFQSCTFNSNEDESSSSTITTTTTSSSSSSRCVQPQQHFLAV